MFFIGLCLHHYQFATFCAVWGKNPFPQANNFELTTLLKIWPTQGSQELPSSKDLLLLSSPDFQSGPLGYSNTICILKQKLTCMIIHISARDEGRKFMLAKPATRNCSAWEEFVALCSMFFPIQRSQQNGWCFCGTLILRRVLKRKYDDKAYNICDWKLFLQLTKGKWSPLDQFWHSKDHKCYGFIRKMMSILSCTGTQQLGSPKQVTVLLGSAVSESTL